MIALDKIDEQSGIYNLGCGGNGYSVLEVIRTAQRVSQHEIPFHIVKRRAGDPAVLIASSDKIKQQLGWNPQYQDLALIIESAWRRRSRRPSAEWTAVLRASRKPSR